MPLNTDARIPRKPSTNQISIQRDHDIGLLHTLPYSPRA